jgi:hypothetical protein
MLLLSLANNSIGVHDIFPGFTDQFFQLFIEIPS